MAPEQLEGKSADERTDIFAFGTLLYEMATGDIWIHHLSRDVATRLTTDLNDEAFPVWSPDGRRIIFGSDRGTGKDASMDFS